MVSKNMEFVCLLNPCYSHRQLIPSLFKSHANFLPYEAFFSSFLETLIIMDWFSLKGVLANLHVIFKQPKNLENLLLSGTRTRDHDVRVRFEEKPRAEQEELLIYLYMNWKDLQQDSSFIEALKETNFVTAGGNGDLYKPKDLYDPGDALLTSLFSDQPYKFPGERFVSDIGWLKILRKTGMQNTRDHADTLIQCARRLEFLGAQHDFLSNTIWSLAETLIKTIFENPALLYDYRFCTVFRKIACVPAKKGYPLSIIKSKLKRVLCSYSEAILLKDWQLAWSAAPILAKAPPDYSWRALQLRSPPPFNIVLKHLQHNALPNLTCFLNLEDAVVEVLKYLDTNWGTLSSSDISKLSNVGFIPTANGVFLVTAGYFVTHLKINLWPIAYELPLRYQPFVKILTKLGLHDTLSFSTAMIFLSRLRSHFLNPNELRAVIELLNYICNEIEQRKLDCTNWESQLVVPDNDCRLVSPNLCLYVDLFGSQYLRFIDSSKLRLVHYDLPERLCLAFGIRKLSDVVVEELDHVENLETPNEIGSVSLATIRLKLLSRSFQVAVSSIVNNFSSNISSEFKKPDFPTLQRLLDSVAERLQFVQAIYTRFWLLQKSLDVTRASIDSTIPKWENESSHHRALYYVDPSNTSMLIAEPPSYLPILDLVAILVSHVLGFPIPLPIAPLFVCPDGYESEVVNILKLPSDHGRDKY